jgi:hypothetical protein
MQCEGHQDVKEDVKTLFTLVGERMKWSTFQWSTRIIVIVFLAIFSLIGTVFFANAEDHEEIREKYTPKDAFKEFRQETKDNFNEIKQLIREINR